MCLHTLTSKQAMEHHVEEKAQADADRCLHRVLPASRERVCFTTWMSVMKPGGPPASLSRLHQLSKAGETTLRIAARLLRLPPTCDATLRFAARQFLISECEVFTCHDIRSLCL